MKGNCNSRTQSRRIKYISISLLLGLSVVYAESQLSDKALHCICHVESNCEEDIGCHPDPDTVSCGAYQIKEVYWIDCGQPGQDYQSCAASKTCSETCIHAYLERYGTYCTEGQTPDDHDFARIQNGGPRGCTALYTLDYWDKVKACCENGSGECNVRGTGGAGEQSEEEGDGDGAKMGGADRVIYSCCTEIICFVSWFMFSDILWK